MTVPVRVQQEAGKRLSSQLRVPGEAVWTRRRFLAGLAASSAALLSGTAARAADDPGEYAEATDPTFQNQLRSKMEELRAKEDFPALLAGVAVRGKVVGVVATGVRKLGAPTPVAATDAMHLGSNTKSMTATVLGTLVDEKKLAWEDTLAKLFPDLAGTMRPEYRDVQVVDLLWHVSGLKGSVPGEDLNYWHRHRGEMMEQRRECTAGLLRQPPDSPPRTKFLYANANYIIAGAIAERIIGTSWETLIRQRLFQPLGMKSAGFGPMGRQDRVDQPWQHQSQDGKLVPVFFDNPPVLGPAGRVHCSLPDWLKYAQAHLKTTDGLVTAATLTRLHTPSPVSDYALGWGVSNADERGRRDLRHRGSNGLSDSYIRVSQVRETAVVVAVNQTAGDEFYDGCLSAIDGMIRERFGV